MTGARKARAVKPFGATPSGGAGRGGWRPLVVALVAAAAASVASVAWPASVEAQRGRASAVNNWVSVWGGLFMDPGTVRDGGDGAATRWDFGTSVAGGVGWQRRFGDALIAGIELGYSPMRHQVLEGTTGNVVLDEGRAHVITTMVAGRLGGGGGGAFSTYLTGAVGSMIYGIPSLERWDPDLALRAGGGLDYRHSTATTFFLEWNRWWVLHQTTGVDDNTVRHSNLQVGVRFGS